VHSDVWCGTAADLAQRNALGVFPVGGWWKEDRRMARYDTPVPCALIVSIRAPDVEIDLYAAVEARIGVPVEAKARVEVTG
jgi:hypothetical protein